MLRVTPPFHSLSPLFEITKMPLTALTSLPPTLPAPHHVLRTRTRPPPLLLFRCLQRRVSTVTASAVRQDTTLWTPSPVSEIEAAAESLFHIAVDVSDNPELGASHTRAGQYLQMRVPGVDKPAFLAIGSPPPPPKSGGGGFEFLVKSVEGSVAELICGLKTGDVVEVSQVMGRGFEIGKIEPPEEFSTVLIFATGSGISPIRSLVEAGFNADKRSDVRLYYGARNLKRMAYQDRFKDWESSGVTIVPVLSQPDDGWTGETGYVQAAFARAKRTYSPTGTGVILCGQKQMAEEVTALVVAEGVTTEKILKNF